MMRSNPNRPGLAPRGDRARRRARRPAGAKDADSQPRSSLLGRPHAPRRGQVPLYTLDRDGNRFYGSYLVRLRPR